MFKIVFVFGLIVVSAADEDPPHFKLSRHAELIMNQTDQTVIESTGKPIADSSKTQQQKSPNRHDETRQTGNERSTGFWQWSLTSNLEMNLLDDWLENKVKVSHISHIYIGESVYPYMYEESRVIQSEASKASSGEDSRLKEVKISEVRYKKEEGVPVYEIKKIYEI